MQVSATQLQILNKFKELVFSRGIESLCPFCNTLISSTTPMVRWESDMYESMAFHEWCMYRRLDLTGHICFSCHDPIKEQHKVSHPSNGRHYHAVCYAPIYHVTKKRCRKV